jgi:secreted PhoX family phosphatase
MPHAMNEMQRTDPARRRFLARSARLAGGALLGAVTLRTLHAHNAWAQGGRRGAADYGPLRPTPDQNGAAILALPEGFDYVTFGETGDPLLGGAGAHPRNHDGMAAFPGPGGTIRLIRNHELRNKPGDFALGVTGDPATRYDARAMGGTITIDFDPVKRRPVREFVSLNGTLVNCAGGLAYHNAGWLSCEETVAGPRQGWEKKHGYTFLVPAAANAAAPAQPITAMGRFVKEAAVADPRTGIVYQTEDARQGSGFYRFLPKNPADLHAGGVLQMLAVAGRPNYDTRSGQTAGVRLPARWVTINDPDPDLEGGAPSCFQQGYAQGAARFERLEGIYRGEDGSIYFVSTSGGNAQYGQLWHYLPDGTKDGALVLAYESTSGALLDSPDNLCVTPAGGILFCEDDTNPTPAHRGDTHPLAPGISEVNRLIGLARDGAPFTFAVNRLNASEFAGACFSPDGTILFVNLFGDATPGSGMTCAIRGPWERGPL